MPLYEYQCPLCGRFELIQKFSDPAPSACPTCGGDVQKLPSAPAIQFKGAGWYVTDYARKSSDGGAKGDAAKADGGDGAKGESGKSGAPKSGDASPSPAPAAGNTPSTSGAGGSK